MRVELTPFSPEEHDVIVHDIAAFWQHHASLANRDEAITSEQAENTLAFSFFYLGLRQTGRLSSYATHRAHCDAA
mgnify:CR=1 FL=1